RYSAIGDPAWHNETEVAEVCRHVECKTVAGDPAADADANGRDLFFAAGFTHPHTGQSLHACPCDAEGTDRTNEHLLQITHVDVHVAAVGFEVDDRITDELARAVIGH